MSESDNDEYHDAHGDGGKDDGQRNKKRKIQRACDVCRRKKIRCDGPQMADGKCTNCITYSYDCTYIEIAKKRGPPKGYVESLENRLEKMENLLKRLCPGADFSNELGPPIERNIWAKDPNAFPARAKAVTGPLSKEQQGAPLTFIGGREDAHTSDDDDESNPPFGNFSITQISSSMSQLDINTSGHFYGKSSVWMHLQNAVDKKLEFLRSKMDGEAMPSIQELFPHFRPEYWQPNPWEVEQPRQRHISELEFPPDDLLDTLVNVYFLSNNCHFPLLHRPTFEQQYHSGLHRSSQPFAEILLLVCAVASRCCDDPRVMLDPTLPHSAGWKYYQQVNVADKNLVTPPTLLDLQRYVLAAWYLLESSCNYAAWAVSGIGLRLAQDVGAHRKKVYGNPISPEDESWKRAFWCLIAIDRTASCTMGRIPAIYDPDIDVDLPLEVDDEYWTAADPTQAFQQPPDKPAQATAFIKLLKLSSIIAYTLQTIYAVNKSQVKGSSGPMWEQQVLAEIDTMLSKWVDELPPHLQWPNQGAEHPVFFTQSTSLYAIFYHTQILVHHPFIPTPKRPTPSTSFPSHQICVNSARSCSHVVDAYRKRSVYFAPWCVVGAISAAIVLLENLWTAGTPFGPATVDVNATMEDVKKCNDVIGIVERRWPATGKLRDILAFLAASDGAAFPMLDRSKLAKPVAGVKRERSVADRPSRSGTGGGSGRTKGVVSRSPPFPIAAIPSMRRTSKIRNTRGVSDASNHPPPQAPQGPGVAISPTDHRAMGPPGLDFASFPTTPATWYGQDSPHPDTTGAAPAGGHGGHGGHGTGLSTPLSATNGSGPDHGPAPYGYGGYATAGPPGPPHGAAHGGPNHANHGPGAAPPAHAQESFMRRDLGDGGVAPGMRGMPMWPGQNTAPPAQDYTTWGAADEWSYRTGATEADGPSH